MKVPPALVMLVFGGSMYVLDRFLPFGYFEFFGKQELAMFLFGLGVLVIFHKNHGRPFESKENIQFSD